MQHKPDIFETLRNGFKAVASCSSHVQIRYDLINQYAETLPDSSPENVFDDEYHYKGDDEALANYVIALDAVNFGSGYKVYMAEEGWPLVNGSIYFTVSTRMKELYETQGPLTASQMASLKKDDIIEYFDLPKKGHYSNEFAALCAQSLNELGCYISNHHEGAFLDFVNSHTPSAAAMVETLISMKNFNDIHPYKGEMVPFYKRAQITVADLQLAFGKSGKVLFDDIGDLTMFADNAVPHVLRVDGLLEYSDELADRIASGERLDSGSDEECEIRGCAAHVVELIAARKNMRAMDVDHILWHRRAENQHYRNTPTHLTLTKFY